jgi:GNAT superfamily N-acetyltransferase
MNLSIISFFHFFYSTPNGICLKQLNHSYVPMINQAWAHKHDGSLFYLERLIERNLSIGAFNKNDNELIAWCLRIENGSFGNLQVSENHQRRGLGSFLVKFMSKKLAEENIDSTAGILDSNQKSREMFQKLGFKHIDNTYWFTISSSIPNFQWTD